MSYQNRLLAENESIKRRAHRHVLFVLLHTLPMVLLGILLWVLAFLAYRYIPTAAGIVAAVLLGASLIPLGIAAYRVMWWKSEEYLVTSLRIVQVEGILSKRSLDSSLGRINDVEMRQSMFGRMFDYGDINILTGSDHAINDLHGIDQPFQFKKALLEAKAEFDGVWPAARAESPAAARADGRSNGREDGNNHRAEQHVYASADMQDTARLDNPGRTLAALTELRNSGVLSEDEYQEKLRQLMNG